MERRTETLAPPTGSQTPGRPSLPTATAPAIMPVSASDKPQGGAVFFTPAFGPWFATAPLSASWARDFRRRSPRLHHFPRVDDAVEILLLTRSRAPARLPSALVVRHRVMGDLRRLVVTGSPAPRAVTSISESCTYFAMRLSSAMPVDEIAGNSSQPSDRTRSTEE